MAYGDPFDAAGADMPPQQAGGVSPDFWRNLAMFGSQMSVAANARTPQGFLAYGNGFAGPFGAGIQGGMQNSMDVAKLRSNLGLQGAQTQGVALGNYEKMLNLPVLQQRARMQQQFYQDPQGFMRSMGMGPQDAPAVLGPQSSADPASSDNTPFAANNPLNIRYAGQDGAKNTNGFAAFPTPEAGQAATNGQFGMYADRGINTLRGLISTWAPPSENNTPAYIARVSGETGIDPDAQIDLRNPAVASVIQHSMAGVEGNKNARVQVAQAGNGPIPMPGGQSQQPAQPQQQQSQPQAQQNIGSSQALATAQHYEQQANQIEMMHSLGLPMPGDPAALRQAAQQYRSLGLAGSEAASKAINSNIDIRPGGMVRAQTPSGPQWIKNPQLEEVQAGNGVTNYVHISPPLPGSPEGTPGTSSPVVDDNGQPAVKKIPKQVQEGLDKSYDEFNGKGADSYVAAKNTQGWLEQMDHAAETINKAGGFLTTGPTAPERIALAANVNDILRTTGLPVIFDPKAIGAWEELTKATTTAGFELSSHYEGHARQAAATIENATSAVPAQKNSPIGYYTVSSGIREAAQSAADMREFAQAPVAKKGGDINQAAIDFYKTITPQMYARRAISNVTPYPVKSDTELSRYLPGTFIQYKGNVVQVPERPGAPPIPDYLKNAHPMVPTQ